MSDLIPPTRAALAEALELSSEILKNLELGEVPLSNIALKTGRLSRLSKRFRITADHERISSASRRGNRVGANGFLRELSLMLPCSGP